MLQFLDDAGTRVSVLAARAQMTKQSMAQLVAHLEAHGYVERVPDPADGRAKLVRATARGREVFALVREFIAELDARLDERMGEAKVRSCARCSRSSARPSRQDDPMAKTIYTAKATVTGGRAEGHGVTDDGALDVQLRTPDVGGGTNPEQLFAVGYAACFEGAIGVLGRREKVEVGDVSIDSQVSLMPTEERGFKLGVVLDVTLPQVEDPEVAERIVRGAHQVCPYSNATRGNIDVALSVNGRSLASCWSAKVTRLCGAQRALSRTLTSNSSSVLVSTRPSWATRCISQAALAAVR